ncbi:restriction endonuclease subunit S [Paenibacillus macerans]|uniref:restriction endonuclease subunit S n=1 Tax=Paenibacillus macerans TaxID=44252 RepID=UPI002E1BE8B8|nr:restriction endonuclease subunit S [Paenibacillus macerans]MED4954502.1 restriction endonuclease subunit S [Paenibacillus macerans]
MVNGWKSVSLLDCGEILQGLTYRPGNVKPYGLLVLRSSNIQDEKLVFDDCVFVDCNVDEKQYVRKGDIIICVRNGSSALIGKCALVDADYKATFGAFMSVFRGENSDYIFQVFRSTIVQKQIRSNSNATINQITKTDFENIVIPVPSDASEQRAIAEALSDVDRYITSLEKLIAKKKAIKQGAMQELLTGKRRLPGFDGEWISGEWQDVLDGFISGATPYRGKPEYYNGTIKWVTSGELNYNKIYDTIEHISEQAKADTSLTVHPVGTFLMAITGLEAAGTRGSCAILAAEATTNQSCMAIYGTEKMDTNYLFHYYILNGDKLALQYCQGTKQQSYTAKIVKSLPIFYPSDTREQMAISTILSDMDSEIEALTAKLNKAKLIKKGMMQELLTGRIRLVQSEAAAVVAAKSELQVAASSSAQKGHNQQFDDAVMIAGIVNAFYSARYPLGRKKVQKLLYLLRRKQDESTVAFKKKAAGPYADEVRYKGGEPIANRNRYIATMTIKGKGTTFTPGENIGQALDYIERWGRQSDIQWLAEKFRYTSVDDLELLATVDMAICDLEEAGIPVSVASIKHLIATNKEWQAKLQKKTFADSKIAKAISDLQTLL